MQKWRKSLFCIVFSFIFLFINVGYAQVADTLMINGTADFLGSNLKGVIIEKVAIVEGDATSILARRLPGTTHVKTTVNGTAGQYVTYEITFKNCDADIKYAFNEVKCEDSTLENNSYFNHGLTVDVRTTSAIDGPSAKGVSIAPGAELKLYATYLIGDALLSITTLLNYEFIVHVDSAGDYAAEKSLERFDEILNSDKTYTAEEASALLGQNVTKPMTKMEILQEIMSTQGGGWGGTGYYVGNVVTNPTAGSKEELHSKVLAELFAGDLSLNLYDPETNTMKETGMTCLIKEQDICGSNTEEMILYMTAEEMNGKCNTSGWLTGYYENRYVKVYAVVFTLVGEEWVQLGDIYDGQANPNNYSGGGRNSDANSFRTDSWRSTEKTYDVITVLPESNGNLVNAYSYDVAASKTLSNIMSTKDTTANSVFKGLLDVSQDVLDGEYGNITGTAVTALEDQMKEIQTYLGTYVTKNADGSYTVSANATRAEIEPYMVRLRALLTPFEDRLIAGKQ